MSWFSQSRLAAHLQDAVARRREEVGLYAEVADLVHIPSTGRLLEVGCGSGQQLGVIREKRPSLKLSGLDLSAAAIRYAKRNLKDVEVDLRHGSIEKTEYENGSFDLVMCFSSMSYWGNLVSCFNEIHRILRPGGAARLVEPQQDIDVDEVVATIRGNLADKSWFRRLAATSVNKIGLKYGRSLGLKLYSTGEISRLIGNSSFGAMHKTERVCIQGLPIFMLITMEKG